MHTKIIIDFNEKMQSVCIACETYVETMKGNNQVFTFVLRSDLTFSDGSPVTAADVKTSYEYFAKNRSGRNRCRSGQWRFEPGPEFPAGGQ